MITLASKRYTIAALGSTLDSRYPNGGASGFTPEAGFTVSGTFADGGSVTIAKASGLGSGPTIAVFDRFEGSNGADVALAATVGSWGSYGTTRPSCDTSLSHSGSSCASVTSASGGAKQIIATFDPTAEFFLSYWMRMTVPASDIVAGQLKCTWLLDGADAYSTAPYDMCWPTWSGNWYIAGNDFNQATDLGVNRLPGNEWTRFSAWAKDNAPSAMDYWVHWIGQTYGVLIDTAPNTNTNFFGTTASTSVDRLNVPGYTDLYRNVTVDGSRNLYYDDFYLATGANAAARVEIGESSTYTSCKELSICPHTSWADTSVTVTAYQGGHASLSGKHLFITNASNTTSYVGAFA